MEIFLLFFFYFIPTVVALIRSHNNSGSIFVINFFFGWTLLGWVIALAMAVSSNTRSQ